MFRFIDKVYRRNRLPEKDRRDIRHALRLEAQKNGPSMDRETWFSLGEWKEPLIEEGFFDDRSASRFYKETESGGLIHLDSRVRWQWTYPWIHKYLISDD